MQNHKSNKDYRNRSIDCETFQNIDFSNVDFSGANLSESVFQACDFRGATFSNTCLAQTTFIESIFDPQALLSMTEQGCAFSSCTCVLGQYETSFDAPPVIISGLNAPIALIGQVILVGRQARKYKEWLWYLASHPKAHIDGIPLHIFEKSLSLFLLCIQPQAELKDIYLRTIANTQ